MWIGSRPGAILAGCAIMLLAVVPLRGLSLDKPVGVAPAMDRPGGLSYFLWRYLVPLSVWAAAIGAFNPFFNVFFARRHGATAESIGLLFSMSQLAQAGAVMAAPLLLRRLGLVRVVMATQIVTGIVLAALPLAAAWPAAALVYVLYMSAQMMSEPGLYSLLMSRVRPMERSAASALNFLVLFSAQALVAGVAGWAYRRFGYGPVLAIAGMTAAAAGVLFGWLMRKHSETLNLADRPLRNRT